MSTIVPVWPFLQLMPDRPMWSIATGGVTGGQNLDGWSQTGVFGGGGFWRCELNRVVVTDDPDQRLTWRAIQAMLDSGASPFVIAWPDFGGVEELSPSFDLPLASFGDGSLFDDGSAFVNSSILIRNVGAAAKNATTLTVNVIYGPEPLPGMDFSVLDDQYLPRRHRIRAAAAVDGEPGQYTIVIRPWLRAAIADGVELNFADPGSVMMLADPKSIFADETGGRFAEVSPVFNEWFGTLPT